MGVHLLSCETCKRQLDVTALRHGDEVCCVCDAVLTVAHPNKVESDAASGEAILTAAFRSIPCNAECPEGLLGGPFAFEGLEFVGWMLVAHWSSHTMGFPAAAVRGV